MWREGDHVSELVRAVRMRLGLSMGALARFMGVPASFVSDVELGRAEPHRGWSDWLVTVAEAAGASRRAMGSDKPTPATERVRNADDDIARLMADPKLYGGKK